jgi:CBS domain-containing protein
MKIKDVMTKDPATLKPDATCVEAAKLMKREDCGSLPIVEGDRLVGIVTDRDIVVRCLASDKDARVTRVSDMMSPDPITIGPDEDARRAQQIMAEHQVRRIPVTDDGRLVGLVVIGQLARRESSEERVGDTLKEISKP